MSVKRHHAAESEAYGQEEREFAKARQFCLC